MGTSALTHQESHKHHFVPKFLLKPWATDGELNGFWWDSRKRRLLCNRRGPRAFCNEIDLLTLEEHEEGRDVLERNYFRQIDSSGAVVRDRLLSDDPNSLDSDERCHFARLLLSLEARRPINVGHLRNYGKQHLMEAIDNDSEIRREMQKEGLTSSPTEFLEERGYSMEDMALGSIQKLVDNPRIGSRLINMSWRVVHLGPFDESLVLSDRPLVRTDGHGHPQEAWFLPLSPKAVFCALNNHGGFDLATPQRIAKRLNVASAGQAEKYVFCTDTTHTRWLPRYLAT